MLAAQEKALQVRRIIFGSYACIIVLEIHPHGTDLSSCITEKKKIIVLAV